MKKLLFSLFLFFSLVSAHSQTEEQLDSLLDNNLFEEAIIGYTTLIKSDQNNSELYRKRGIAYFNINENLKGEYNIRTALKIDASCHKCYLNLAQHSLIRNDLESAFKFADSSLKIEKSSIGYYFKGIVYYSSKQFFDAISEFNEALYIDSLKHEAFYYVGLSYLELNFKTKAFENLKNAIKIDSTLAEYHYRLSLILNLQEKYAESIPFLNKAISIDSKKHEYYKDLGSVYQLNKEFRKSNEFYFKSLALLTNEKGQLYYNIADNYYKMENMDSSCYYLDLSLKYESENKDFILKSYDDHCDSTLPNYYFQRGIALYNIGEFEKSVAYHEKGIEKFPENNWLWNFRGNSLMASQHYTKAIESYKKSIEFYTNENYRKIESEKSLDASKSFRFTAVFSISECYIKLNELDSAWKYIEISENRATKMVNPEFGIYASALVETLKGDYFYLLEDTEKALEHYNESINLSKENTDPRYKRAMIYLGRNSSKIEKHRMFTLKMSTVFEDFEYKNHSIKKATSVDKIELSIALSDCDYILKITPKEAKVYLLRAIIKKELGYFNYCTDIQKAIEYGIYEANKIANLNCKI